MKSSIHYRHTHLQQQLLKERIQLLHRPAQPPVRAPDANRALDPGDTMATGECDNDLQQNTGTTHVGLLRAGAARHVIAALADGQVLMYRENGEKAWTCTCMLHVTHIL